VICNADYGERQPSKKQSPSKIFDTQPKKALLVFIVVIELDFLSIFSMTFLADQVGVMDKLVHHHRAI
jgi:hypothetical protein